MSAPLRRCAPIALQISGFSLNFGKLHSEKSVRQFRLVVGHLPMSWRSPARRAFFAKPARSHHGTKGWPSHANAEEGSVRRRNGTSSCPPCG